MIRKALDDELKCISPLSLAGMKLDTSSKIWKLTITKSNQFHCQSLVLFAPSCRLPLLWKDWSFYCSQAADLPQKNLVPYAKTRRNNSSAKMMAKNRSAIRKYLGSSLLRWVRFQSQFTPIMTVFKQIMNMTMLSKNVVSTSRSWKCSRICAKRVCGSSSEIHVLTLCSGGGNVVKMAVTDLRRLRFTGFAEGVSSSAMECNKLCLRSAVFDGHKPFRSIQSVWLEPFFNDLVPTGFSLSASNPGRPGSCNNCGWWGCHGQSWLLWLVSSQSSESSPLGSTSLALLREDVWLFVSESSCLAGLRTLKCPWLKRSRQRLLSNSISWATTSRTCWSKVANWLRISDCRIWTTLSASGCGDASNTNQPWGYTPTT